MESNRRGRGRGRERRSRGRFSQGYPEDIQPRKPAFKCVEDICPEMTGLNLKLKVASTRTESSNEFLMGDHTGNVIVKLNNASLIPRLQEGTSVYIRNGFVEMKNDAFIRLTVNDWGKIDLADENFDFIVKKGTNISEVEYTIE